KRRVPRTRSPAPAASSVSGLRAVNRRRVGVEMRFELGARSGACLAEAKSGRLRPRPRGPLLHPVEEDRARRCDARLAHLRRLLSPGDVGFTGGQRLGPIIQYCVAAGFTGESWPVNPNYPEIGGRRCYKRLADLPEAPDASFIAVPREPTVELVCELAPLGAGGAGGYAPRLAAGDRAGAGRREGGEERASELVA